MTRARQVRVGVDYGDLSGVHPDTRPHKPPTPVARLPLRKRRIPIRPATVTTWANGDPVYWCASCNRVTRDPPLCDECYPRWRSRQKGATDQRPMRRTIPRTELVDLAQRVEDFRAAQEEWKAAQKHRDRFIRTFPTARGGDPRHAVEQQVVQDRIRAATIEYQRAAAALADQATDLTRHRT